MISTVLRNQRWIKTNPCFQNPPEFSGSSVLDEFSVSPIPLPLDRVSLPSLELKLHKVLLMYPHGPGRIKLYFWTLKLAFNIPRYTQPQDFTLGGPSKYLLNWKQTSFIEVRRFSIYVKLEGRDTNLYQSWQFGGLVGKSAISLWFAQDLSFSIESSMS